MPFRHRNSGQPVRGLAGLQVVARFDNPRAVQEALDAQKVKAVLHVGQTFSADVAAGRPTRVQLVLDGRKSNAALILQSYALGIVEATISRGRARPPPS